VSRCRFVVLAGRLLSIRKHVGPFTASIATIKHKAIELLW
jgi:hypothetical protein